VQSTGAGASRAVPPIMPAHMNTPNTPDAHRPPLAVPPPRPPAHVATPRARTSLTVLVLIFVGFVSLGLPDGLLGVAWPSMRQTFGLPLDALGALFMTSVLGYLVASLASGWIVDRIGVGLLLALSALATTVSLLTFAFAPGWAFIVVIGVVTGLGAGAIDTGLNSYVALLHSPRLLAWLHACFGIGAATGPAIMMAVLDAGQSWRIGYAIVGAGQLALGLCFLATRRQWEASPQPAPAAHTTLTAPQLPLPLAGGGEHEQVRGVGAALGGQPRAVANPAVWLSVTLFLLYTGVETTAGQWAYTLFVEGRGVSTQAASFGVSAYWAALALGRVLAGIIDDRVSPATLTRWSMGGMLVGAVLIWLNAAVWVSFAGLGLIGLAAAPVFPTLIGATPQRFGPAQAATVIGFQVGAASLGIAGLPALAGVLAVQEGLEVIPLVLVVGAVVMVALHEGVLRLAARVTARAAAA
jgi:fucose permease